MKGLGRLVGISCAAALLPAGCSGSSSTPGPAVATAPITFQVKAEPEEAAVYRSLLAAYEKSADGGPVEMTAVGRKDHLTRLTSAFASGKPPDVFLINYREYAPFVERGAIEPIAPLMRAAGVDLGEFYAEPVAAFTLHGSLQCMPQNISSMVVYWNTALFDAAGVPAPTPEWTWQEFTAAAKALTSGDVKGVGFDPTITRLAPVIWGNGGRIVDDPVKPTRLTLDEPPAREALETMLRLSRDGVTPDKESVAAQDLVEQFMTGSLAMFLSSRVEVPALREQRGLAFDVAPLPGLKQPASILHSDAYCIAKTSPNQAAAARFIAYAVGQQGASLTALGGRTVPSMTAVAQSPAFLDPVRAPKSSQVFLDNIPHPHTPRWCPAGPKSKTSSKPS